MTHLKTFSEIVFDPADAESNHINVMVVWIAKHILLPVVYMDIQHI